MTISRSTSRRASRVLTSVTNPSFACACAFLFSSRPPRHRAAKDDVVFFPAAFFSGTRALPHPSASTAASRTPSAVLQTAPTFLLSASLICFRVLGLTRKNISCLHAGATVFSTTFVRNTWSSFALVASLSVPTTYASEVPVTSAALMFRALTTRTRSRVFRASAKYATSNTSPLVRAFDPCASHALNLGSARWSRSRAVGMSPTDHTICPIASSAPNESWSKSSKSTALPSDSFFSTPSKTNRSSHAGASVPNRVAVRRRSSRFAVSPAARCLSRVTRTYGSLEPFESAASKPTAPTTQT